MTVKRSKSGTRVLSVLEHIARHQPIGVSELARTMAADKSAVQRAIATLADEGWVHATSGGPRQWQLTGHIHAVAHLAQRSSTLRQRALPVLIALRDRTGETAFLTVPDVRGFVVVEVVESRHLLRTAPHVGMAVLPGDSATGRAVLPHLPVPRREELLGGAASGPLEGDFAAAMAQGYAVSHDTHATGSINVAAPIFEVDGAPAGAVVLSAPAERLTPEGFAAAGEAVAAAARALSRRQPAT